MRSTLVPLFLAAGLTMAAVAAVADPAPGHKPAKQAPAPTGKAPHPGAAKAPPYGNDSKHKVTHGKPDGWAKGDAAKADARAKADAARADGTAKADAARASGDPKYSAGAKGDEMQVRRDERKDVQETYREGAEGGSAQSGSAQAGKKPWWKFWQG